MKIRVISLVLVAAALTLSGFANDVNQNKVGLITQLPVTEKPTAQTLYDSCKEALAVTQDKTELLYTYCGSTIEMFIFGAGLGGMDVLSEVSGDMQYEVNREWQKSQQEKKDCALKDNIPYYELSRKNPEPPSLFFVKWVDSTGSNLSDDPWRILYEAFYENKICDNSQKIK